MSVAKTTFAITFALFVSITLVFPNFPPAQLIYEYVRMPQTTLSIWGITIATLLNGITNGFFWMLVAATVYGVALYSKELKPLPPMPVAPHLSTPPPENPLVDFRVNRIPPALTIPLPPSSTAKEEPTRALIRTEPLPTKFSDVPIGTETEIEAFEGIGLVCGGLLRNLGINTVSGLLRAGATERGRDRIANEVGVTSATVLKWVRREDLLRVKGIGRKYSALLESAGINTVADLSTKNPNYLCQMLKVVNRERNLVGRSPPSKKIEIWVCNAKKIEPILVE